MESNNCVINKPAPKQTRWINDKFDGVLSGGSLVDIHRMLENRKTISEIAIFYKASEKTIQDFLVQNQNATWGEYPPGFNLFPMREN